MTPRAIRRAAERKAAKLAAKAAKVMTTSAGSVENEIHTISVEIEPRPTSDAQLAANRANARLSHGATTDAGRRASSQNSRTHGLTCQSALVPGDDKQAYENLVESHFERHAPATDEERELVQLIADSKWRLLKIAPLEAGIYEVGRIEQGESLFPNEKDPVRRAGLVDSAIAMLYTKHLKNLHLQERRIRNQHTADVAKLQQLQIERLEKPQRHAEQAKEANSQLINRADAIDQECQFRNIPFVPTEFGLDFSAEEWEHYKTRQRAYFDVTKEYLDFYKVLAQYRAAKEAPQAA
jgi:hypothetical protein